MHSSYQEDKGVLLARLRKIEGQVRGIQQMIEDDRYCGDVLQQINALTAAAREVAVLLAEDHVRACVTNAVSGEDREAMIKEAMKVLRKTLRP